jgi:hypothetical protein
MTYEQKVIKLGGICGIVGCFIYLGVAILLEQLFWQRQPINTTQDFLTIMGGSPGYQINMSGHLLMPLAMLFFLVAFIGLKHLLSFEKQRISVTIGTLLGIISCPIYGKYGDSSGDGDGQIRKDVC